MIMFVFEKLMLFSLLVLLAIPARILIFAAGLEHMMSVEMKHKFAIVLFL